MKKKNHKPSKKASTHASPSKGKSNKAKPHHHAASSKTLTTKTEKFSKIEDLESETAPGMEGADAASSLAAASRPDGGTVGLKNFRHHPDMENFYRFIHENDLRFEALQLLDEVMMQKQALRQLKDTKSRAH